jgi:hypothetical protein
MKEVSLSKDELVFRVKGAGCKMLDRLDLEEMSKDEIITHLKKSCCKVYDKLVLRGELKELDKK